MALVFSKISDQFTVKVKVDYSVGDSTQTFSFHCRFRRLPKSAMDDLISRIDDAANLDEALPLYREFWLGFEPDDLKSWAPEYRVEDPETGEIVVHPIREDDGSFKALLDDMPIRQSIIRTWFMANAGDKARRKN